MGGRRAKSILLIFDLLMSLLGEGLVMLLVGEGLWVAAKSLI